MSLQRQPPFELLFFMNGTVVESRNISSGTNATIVMPAPPTNASADVDFYSTFTVRVGLRVVNQSTTGYIQRNFRIVREPGVPLFAAFLPTLPLSLDHPFYGINSLFVVAPSDSGQPGHSQQLLEIQAISSGLAPSSSGITPLNAPDITRYGLFLNSSAAVSSPSFGSYSTSNAWDRGRSLARFVSLVETIIFESLVADFFDQMALSSAQSAAGAFSQLGLFMSGPEAEKIVIDLSYAALRTRAQQLASVYASAFVDASNGFRRIEANPIGEDELSSFLNATTSRLQELVSVATEFIRGFPGRRVTANPGFLAGIFPYQFMGNTSVVGTTPFGNLSLPFAGNTSSPGGGTTGIGNATFPAFGNTTASNTGGTIIGTTVLSNVTSTFQNIVNATLTTLLATTTVPMTTVFSGTSSGAGTTSAVGTALAAGTTSVAGTTLAAGTTSVAGTTASGSVTTAAGTTPSGTMSSLLPTTPSGTTPAPTGNSTTQLLFTPLYRQMLVGSTSAFSGVSTLLVFDYSNYQNPGAPAAEATSLVSLISSINVPINSFVAFAVPLSLRDGIMSNVSVRFVSNFSLPIGPSKSFVQLAAAGVSPPGPVRSFSVVPVNVTEQNRTSATVVLSWLAPNATGFGNSSIPFTRFVVVVSLFESLNSSIAMFNISAVLSNASIPLNSTAPSNSSTPSNGSSFPSDMFSFFVPSSTLILGRPLFYRVLACTSLLCTRFQAASPIRVIVGDAQSSLGPPSSLFIRTPSPLAIQLDWQPPSLIDPRAPNAFAGYRVVISNSSNLLVNLSLSSAVTSFTFMATNRSPLTVLVFSEGLLSSGGSVRSSVVPLTAPSPPSISGISLGEPNAANVFLLAPADSGSGDQSSMLFSVIATITSMDATRPLNLSLVLTQQLTGLDLSLTSFPIRSAMLVPGVNYSISVSVQNAVARSNPSSLAYFRTASLPTQPQALIASESTAGLVVNWTAPANTGFGKASSSALPVSLYWIDVSTDPSFTTVIDAVVSGHLSFLVLSSVPRGQRYFVRARACTLVGCSAFAFVPNGVEYGLTLSLLFVSPSTSLTSAGSLVTAAVQNFPLNATANVTLLTLVGSVSVPANVSTSASGIASIFMILPKLSSASAGAATLRIVSPSSLQRGVVEIPFFLEAPLLPAIVFVLPNQQGPLIGRNSLSVVFNNLAASITQATAFRVLFNLTEASMTNNAFFSRTSTAATLSFVVPPGRANGVVNVSITFFQSENTTLMFPYEYFSNSYISAVRPAQALSIAGTLVEVSVENFQTNVNVDVRNVSISLAGRNITATFVAIDSAQRRLLFQFVTPQLPSGNQTIQVSAGTVSNLTAPFVVIKPAALRINNIAPSVGVVGVPLTFLIELSGVFDSPSTLRVQVSNSSAPAIVTSVSGSSVSLSVQFTPQLARPENITITSSIVDQEPARVVNALSIADNSSARLLASAPAQVSVVAPDSVVMAVVAVPSTQTLLAAGSNASLSCALETSSSIVNSSAAIVANSFSQVSSLLSDTSFAVRYGRQGSATVSSLLSFGAVDPTPSEAVFVIASILSNFPPNVSQNARCSVLFSNRQIASVTFSFRALGPRSGPASVVSVQPTSGTGNGGAVVSILAANFTFVTRSADVVVRFGDRVATVLSVSIFQDFVALTVISPQLCATDPSCSGTVTVSVAPLVSLSNVASFPFNYIDPTPLSVTALSTDVIYTTGSEQLMLSFVNAPASATTSDVSLQFVTSVGTVVSATISACTSNAAGVLSQCSVVCPAVSSGSLLATLVVRTRQATFKINAEVPPQGAAVVSFLSASRANIDGSSIATVVLSNFRRVVNSSLIITIGPANNDSRRDVIVLSLTSSLSVSQITFLLPVRPEGNAVVNIYPTTDSSNAAIFSIAYFDLFRPIFSFVAPSAGRQDRSTFVMIALSNVRATEVVHPANVSISIGSTILSASKASILSTSSATTTLLIEATFPSSASSGVVNVSLFVGLTSGNRSVAFAFSYLAPTTVRVVSVAPSISSTLGGSLCAVRAENLDSLPVAASVTFNSSSVVVVNVTGIARIGNLTQFEFVVPAVSSTGVLSSITLQANLSDSTTRSSSFSIEFRSPPNPIVERLFPSFAPAQENSIVTLALLNLVLPRSSSESIIVAFGSVSASVVSFGAVSSGSFVSFVVPTALPVGTSSGTVFNSGIPGSVGSFSLPLVDVSRPRVSSVSPSSGFRSGGFPVRIIVDNVARGPSLLSVRFGSSVAIVQSFSQSGKNLLVDVIAPSSTQAASTSVVLTIDSNSAETSFTFIDPLSTRIESKLPLRVPAFNPDPLTITISNFPIVQSTSQILAQLAPGGAVATVDSIAVSTASSTTLIVRLPTLSISSITTYSVSIIPSGFSQQSVSFSVDYVPTIPSITSTSQSLLPDVGGVTLLIAMENVAFSGSVADLSVSIGATSIPASNVSIVTNSIRSLVLSVTTPALPVGRQDLTVQSVSSGVSVSSPVTVFLSQAPATKFVSTRSLNSATGGNVSLSISNVASNMVSSVNVVQLLNGSTVVANLSLLSVSFTSLTSSLSFVVTVPAVSSSGRLTLFIPSLTISEAIQMADLSVPALTSVTPASGPVTGLFPISIALTGISATVPLATTLSVVIDGAAVVVSSLSRAGTNAVVVVSAPASTKVSSVPLLVVFNDTQGRQISLSTSFAYVQACDYSDYCSRDRSGDFPDFELFQRSPPISELCRPEYCRDPNTFRVPQQVSLNVTLGPVTGRTVVEIVFRDLFFSSASDLLVQFGTAFASLVSATRLRNGNSMLVFSTPSVSSAGRLRAVVSSSKIPSVGSFFFTFEEVLSLNPVVQRIFPSSFSVSTVASRLLTIDLSGFPVNAAATGRVFCSSNATSFTPSISALVFGSNTQTRVQCLFPPFNASGSISVTITHLDLSLVATSSIEVVPRPPPQFVRVSPQNGAGNVVNVVSTTIIDWPMLIVPSNATVLVSGVGFNGSNAVANLTSVQYDMSSSVLSATFSLPVDPSGLLSNRVNVTLFVASIGASATFSFTYSLSPFVSFSFPRAGSARGGESLTVVVANVPNRPSSSSFTCGGTAVSSSTFNYLSFSQSLFVAVVMPAVAAAGPVTCSIALDMGSSSVVTLETVYTYSQPPVVVSPFTGPQVGGYVVSIELFGSTLSTTASDYSVTLGGITCSVISAERASSDVVLRFTAPSFSSNGPQTGSVSVGTSSFSFGFTSIATPSLISLTPSSLAVRSFSEVEVAVAFFPRIRSPRDVNVFLGSTRIPVRSVLLSNSAETRLLIRIPPQVSPGSLSLSLSPVGVPPSTVSAYTLISTLTVFRPPTTVQQQPSQIRRTGDTFFVTFADFPVVTSPSDVIVVVNKASSAVVTSIVFSNVERTRLRIRSPVLSAGFNVFEASVSGDSVLFSIFAAQDDTSITCRSGCTGPASAGFVSSFELRGFPVLQDVSELRIVFGGSVTVIANSIIRSDPSITVFNCVVPSVSQLTYSSGSSFVNVDVTLSAESSFFVQSMLIFLSAPTLSSAVFGSTGTFIMISFDQQTDIGGAFNPVVACNQVVNGSSVSQLGVAPLCVWETPARFMIVLGRGATLSVGGRLVLNFANGLRSSNGLSDNATLFDTIVNAPSFVENPRGIIRGPSLVGSCDPLIVSFIGTSPRPLTLRWSCTNEPSLNNRLSTVSSTVLTLQPSDFSLDGDFTYQFSVDVSNFLGGATTFAFNVSRLGLPTPSILISGADYYIRSDRILLRAQTSFSACERNPSEVTFKWVVATTSAAFPANLLESVRGPVLNIAPNSLSSGKLYTVNLEGTVGNDTSRVSRTLYSFFVDASPIKAVLIGGSDRTVPRSDFTLDASSSWDPDNVTDGSLSMTFSWKCTIVSTNEPCQFPNGTVVSFDATSRVVFPSDAQLINSSYDISVQCFKDTRTGSASSRLTIADSLSPILTTSFTQSVGVAAADDGSFTVFSSSSELVATVTSNRPNTTFSFSVVSALGPIDVSRTARVISDGTNSISIAGIVSSVPLGVQLSLIVDGRTSSSSRSVTRFVVNRPPQFGNCIATQSARSAGPSLVEVLLTCSDWVASSFPLYYQASYSSSGRVIRGQVSTENTMSLFVPAPLFIPFTVFISDSYGSTTTFNVSLSTAAPLIIASLSDAVQSARRLGSLSTLNSLSSSFGARTTPSRRLLQTTSADLESLLSSTLSTLQKTTLTLSSSEETLQSVSTLLSQNSAVITATAVSTTTSIMSLLGAGFAQGSTSADSVSNMMTLANTVFVAMGAPARLSALNMSVSQISEVAGSVESLFSDVLRSRSSGRISGDASLSADLSVVSSTLRRLKLSSELGVLQVLSKSSSVVFPVAGYTGAISVVVSSSSTIDLVSSFVNANYSSLSATTQILSGVLSVAAFEAGSTSAIAVNSLQSNLTLSIPAILPSTSGLEVNTVLSKSRCAYWNTTSSSWAFSGCTLVSLNGTYAVCNCDRLARYAVMYDSANIACGDGKRQGSEGCDDGNFVSGDGCSSCAIESGWNCTPLSNGTDRCTPVCGNGRRYGGKACDDGNTAAGDGCASNCTIEYGYRCLGGNASAPDVCSVFCGDGIIFGSESCDDGNSISGDGCNATCSLENLGGRNCTNSAKAVGWTADTFCTVCGDSKRLPGFFNGEECDNGNAVGCSSCRVSIGFRCSQGTVGGSDNCAAICGDGIVANNECDDGNTANNDGCSSSCGFESGFYCTQGNITTRTVCTSRCGDGFRVGSEQCDDANNNNVCGGFCMSDTYRAMAAIANAKWSPIINVWEAAVQREISAHFAGMAAVLLGRPSNATMVTQRLGTAAFNAKSKSAILAQVEASHRPIHVRQCVEMVDGLEAKVAMTPM